MNAKHRISKEEREYIEKQNRRELVLDIIILAVSVIAVLLVLGFVVGVLNGQNCN